MDSVTDDFTALAKEGANNNLNLRNALSTVKRKCQRRKILNIMPLPMVEIEKELQEAANEPLCELNPATKEDTELNKENGLTNKYDSFNLDFAVLSLTTPAKQNETTKYGGFATPQPDFKPTVRLSNKPNRMLEYQYTTPKNTVVPKVQCSVNMQTYLKTPINKLCVIQDESAVKGAKQQSNNCDLKLKQVQSLAPHRNPAYTTFKKIHVKNVEYIILNELGKGGSSEVFHCYNVQEKTHRAIKCVSLQNPASASGFINEVKMLKTLQKCNRIIKMFDFEINEEAKLLLVVLEVGGADLSKILKESAVNSAHMPVYMLLYYWMEMLYAVKQIHLHGIIHSDLKPANFLKVEGYLKLIDFGIASCVQNDMTSVIKMVPEGSFNYISPEALNNENSSNVNSPSYGKPKYKISFKSDVWSLGCILYQLVYRRTPFQHVTQMWMKLSMILDPHHRIEYPDADWVSNKIINTVKSCLRHDAKLRPSIDDLIADYENVFQNLS